MTTNQNNHSIDIEEQLANIRKLGAERDKMLAEHMKHTAEWMRFTSRKSICQIVVITALVTIFLNAAAYYFI